MDDFKDLALRANKETFISWLSHELRIAHPHAARTAPGSASLHALAMDRYGRVISDIAVLGLGRKQRALPTPERATTKNKAVFCLEFQLFRNLNSRSREHLLQLQELSDMFLVDTGDVLVSKKSEFQIAAIILIKTSPFFGSEKLEGKNRVVRKGLKYRNAELHVKEEQQIPPIAKHDPFCVHSHAHKKETKKSTQAFQSWSQPGGAA